MKGSIDFQALLRPTVRDLSPYVVEKIEHRIKMDANENPYPWPPDLLNRVMEKLERTHLNRYPDPSAEELRVLLAGKYEVRPSQIMVGNGSDELIQYILLAFGGEGVKTLSPVPTFAMYEIASQATGCEFIGVPLGLDSDLDLAAMRSAIEKEKPRILFLAYPNNPTGNCFRAESVEALLQEFEGIVVIDEAYFDFSRRSFLPRLKEQENLLIMRTLSKIGLAGLRVGIVIGQESLIQMISRVRLPYNLNTFSQVAAVVVLSEDDFIDGQLEILIAERERVFLALAAMKGILPYPSEANFILVRAEDSQRLFRELLSRGILVRSFGTSGPLRNHLRVTVGRPEENDLFLETAEGLFRKGGR